MMWGEFTTRSKLQLAFTTSKMDSIDYQRILIDHLNLYLRRLTKVKFNFECDNTSVNNVANTMLWIDHLIPQTAIIWRYYGNFSSQNLCYKLYKRNDEFQESILKAWDEIDKPTFINLIEAWYSSLCHYPTSCACF